MNYEEKILDMLTAMRSDIVDLKVTQTEQGKALAEMQSTLAEHGKTLGEMQSTLAEHSAILAEHSAKLKELDERSLKSAVILETDVPRDINRLYEARSEIVRKLNTLATKEQVAELSSEVDAIKAVVTRHSGDISRLKKAQ